MISRYLSLFLLGLCIFLWACKKEPNQTEKRFFEKTFGSNSEDLGNDIVVSEEGIYILGSITTLSGKQAILIKTDLNGEEIWNVQFGSGSSSNGKAMLLEENGSITVCGTSNDKLSIFNVSSAGAVNWESTSDSLSSQGAQLIKTSNSYMVCGTVNNGDRDLLVSKFSLNGAHEWSRSYGGEMSDGGSGIQPMLNGNYLAYGYTESFGNGDRDHWLVEISPQGDQIASTTVGGSGYEESQEVIPTADNGFLICGHSASIDPSHDMHVVKLSQSLNIEWENHLGKADAHDGGEGITVDDQGNIYVVGRSNGHWTLGEQVFLSKLSSNGTLLWDTLIGGMQTDRGNAIRVNATHYFVIGSTNSIGYGDDDLFLIKRPR